jgi:hypothetical protein
MTSGKGYYDTAYLDMFDYGSPAWGRRRHDSAEAAVDYAKASLRGELEGAYKPGMTAMELVEKFMMFGEDVLVIAMDGAPEAEFSGLEYVREVAASLCAGRPIGAEELDGNPSH